MRSPFRHDIAIAAAVATVLVAASLAGLSRVLGAHPWWAQQTGVVGGVGGAFFWLALRRAGLPASGQAVLGACALLAAAAAAHFGRQVFVASFAENALAGRLWYFGWFAVSGSVALLVATAAALVLRR